MSRVYKINYDELVQFDDEVETTDTRMNINVVSDDAELAVERLRKKLIGKLRVVKGIEGETYKGKVADLRINEVVEGDYIDMR